MSILTPWGYTLTTLNSLDSIISVQDFNTMTASKYATDSRLQSVLNSASQMIRDYCGWHLCPSTSCEFKTTFYDNRVTVNRDILIQLPARFVTGITSVKIGDTYCQSYVFETNGILRIYEYNLYIHPSTSIEVEYTAGVPDGLANALKDIAGNKAVKALVKVNGVSAEMVGSMQISYNSAWMNEAAGIGAVEKSVLNPYTLRGVF